MTKCVCGEGWRVGELPSPAPLPQARCCVLGVDAETFYDKNFDIRTKIWFK